MQLSGGLQAACEENEELQAAVEGVGAATQLPFLT